MTGYLEIAIESQAASRDAYVKAQEAKKAGNPFLWQMQMSYAANTARVARVWRHGDFSCEDVLFHTDDGAPVHSWELRDEEGRK